MCLMVDLSGGKVEDLRCFLQREAVIILGTARMANPWIIDLCSSLIWDEQEVLCSPIVIYIPFSYTTWLEVRFQF